MKCNKSENNFSNFLKYFTSKEADTAKEFIKNLQFIILHNTMDLGAVDMVRRCNCASLRVNPTQNSTRMAATCTGCI